MESFDKLIKKYNLTEEKSADDMRLLVEHGIAFHHAGMLPSLKEVIEELFTHRLLKLIFTTETFALGINMPARAVVFDDLQKYYGDGFRDLTTRDFYQMAGRAGRRGMDDEGHVYVRVNPKYLNYQSVIKIIYGETEPIFSQFNAAYATLLNLFRFMGYELVKIYPDSLHCYQSSKKRRLEASRLMERKIDLFKNMNYIKDDQLTKKGEFASALFGYELILAEMYDAGELDKLTVSQLCMLLSALAFEPRKNTPAPKLDPGLRKLESSALHHFHAIHHQEVKYKVYPHTRPPHFHLALAMQAWSRNLSFNEIFRYADVDEGEMIRNFRMVIQLLRELRTAPHVSDILKDKASLALDRVRRDIVDAEAQLSH
jgi:superfamily II RNA helicase